MSLAFICNIKSLPHLALCIFYLIKIEAVNSHVLPLFILSLASSNREMPYSCPRGPSQSDVMNQDLGNISSELVVYNY